MKPHFRFTPPARSYELEGVHRRALARLLVQGARRHGQRGRGIRAYAALLQPVGRRWRRRARRLLALLEAETWQVEGRELLGELVAGQADGSSQVEIIALAIEIWPSPENYLALGQALLVAGRAKEGQAVYAFLLRDLHRFEYEGPSLRWRVREGLAAAWEALGKDRVARGCLVMALEDPQAGAGPLISALFLALELGRADEARGLAARIDARFHGASRRADVCGESLRARVELLRAGRWVPPLASARVFGELVRGSGRSAGICRSLVGLSGEVL
jgi:hypothetical protein